MSNSHVSIKNRYNRHRDFRDWTGLEENEFGHIFVSLIGQHKNQDKLNRERNVNDFCNFPCEI